MSTAIAFAVRTAAILALAAAIWFFASAEPSDACSCLPLRPPSESLASATEVFQGVVTSVEEYDTDYDTRLAMEFDVSVVWKGQVGNSITITTSKYGSACGRPLGLGIEYIVYSYEGSTGLCDRTHQVGRAGYNDREELGPGRAPDSTAANPTPNPPAVGGCGRASSSGADIWWAALALGAAWMARGRS